MSTPTKRRAPITCRYVAFALDGDPLGGLKVALLPGDTTPTDTTDWPAAVTLDDAEYPWGALVGPAGSDAPGQLQHAGLGVYTLWRCYAAAPELDAEPVCTVHIVAKP